jgi:hypothetical protein
MNEDNEKEIIIKLAKMLNELDAAETNNEAVTMERKCICGNIVSINAKYCDKCGQRLTPKEKPRVIIKKINIF